MPSVLSYPGVYVEEIPSGVRTITGVATSITAFLGRAPRGPTNAPTILTSFGDFERQFGRLNAGYPLGYAVRDFYLNGGSQAIVVRLYNAGGGKATAKLAVGGLNLVAANPGAWGNNLRVRVDAKVSAEVAAQFGLTAADLFNLTVCDTSTGATERFLNVTGKDSPRRVDRALADGSALIHVPSSSSPPFPVPTAHLDPPAGTSVWSDDKYSTGVAVADQAVDSVALKDADYQGDSVQKTGLYALDQADLFNLLCLPPDQRGGDTTSAVYGSALSYCAGRRAMLIVDAPAAWATNPNFLSQAASKLTTDINLTGTAARNAALFFPRVVAADPNLDGQLDTFAPCGIVAGVMARTDAQRGVWKAPAGLDAGINGVQGLSRSLTNEENGLLNPLGINCLRILPPAGTVVWGARTLRGADQLADEYKYIPVRRLALYIEESLYRGTQWVVFEPNDEPLWAQIRLNVGAFMHGLFRLGAFQGQTPKDAYFVKCDKETTPQDQINLGIVNIVVGFAPLKPAEFVVIQVQQMAGQIET